MSPLPTIWLSETEQRKLWPQTPTIPKRDPDAMDPEERRKIVEIVRRGSDVSHVTRTPWLFQFARAFWRVFWRGSP